jgi:uncharacterized coiled-coil protein SlyX
MNQRNINLKTITRSVRNSLRPLHRHVSLRCLLVPLTLACFGLSPMAQAVTTDPSDYFPGANTAVGQQALLSLTTGVWNTALGYQALYHDTTGHSNTATGLRALFSNSAGVKNTADGVYALHGNVFGSQNTAIGYQALSFGDAPGDNTAVGYRALYITARAPGAQSGPTANTAVGSQALYNNGYGVGNIALGFRAGFNLSNNNLNIDIGNTGVTGDEGVIRIGTTGQQINAFIAGIRGVTTGNNNAIPVVIDTAGQLGTMSSSRRFKTAIKPMDQASQAILALKPVTFHYKSDATGTAQFGLIAEEVAEVNPDLVVRDEDGEIYTVRYDAINAMLLNEFLKEHRKVEEQSRKIAEQEAAISQVNLSAAKREATIAELKSTVAKQRKEMEVLTAQLNEQVAQLQKVSAELEVSKPSPQTVFNDQ